MLDWFARLAAAASLSADQAAALDQEGFVVIAGAVPSQRMASLPDVRPASGRPPY